MAFAARNRTSRADHPAGMGATRFTTPDRVLVIGDCGASRNRVVSLLGDAGYASFEQPSPIGATRMIIHHGIPAVVVESATPGLSFEKLLAVLRNNPRLDGLIVVVVTSLDCAHQAFPPGLEQADAVVFREQVASRLIPTLRRLLCTSGFHPRAPSIGPLRGWGEDA